jgi:transcriptional regulator with XRE-family HTH domain
MAVTQLQIAREVGIDVSSVNKILNKSPGPVFKKETIRKVFRVARDLGFDFGKLKFQHRRRHPRKRASIPLELSIYSAEGVLEQKGSAIIQDLSLNGAQLGGIVLPQQVIPIRPHFIGIRLLDGPLKEVELRCRLVRFLETQRGFDIGVEFLNVQKLDLRMLRKLV